MNEQRPAANNPPPGGRVLPLNVSVGPVVVMSRHETEAAALEELERVRTRLPGRDLKLRQVKPWQIIDTGNLLPTELSKEARSQIAAAGWHEKA